MSLVSYFAICIVHDDFINTNTSVAIEYHFILELSSRTAFTECIIGDSGLDYIGKQVTTVSGRTCQPWSRQSPHRHPFTDEQFPERSKKAASNYCRNPDNKDGGPWCFTQDPMVEWEFCGIYRCSGK